MTGVATDSRRGLRGAALSWLEGRSALEAGQPDWLRGRRADAAGRFEAGALPTTNDEAWRFTPLARLTKVAFGAAPDGQTADTGWLETQLEELDARARVVLVDGRRVSELATDPPAGIEVMGLSEALDAGLDLLEPSLLSLAAGSDDRVRAFSDLNAALLEDVVVVRIRRDAASNEPLHLVVAASAQAEPTASHPRILILAEPGTRAAIVESTLSPEGARSLTNIVTEISLGDGAVLDHVRIQRQGPEASELAVLAVTVGRDASYTSHAVSLGSHLARLELDVVLAGTGASCSLDGLYVGQGEQFLEHQTFIDHRVTHGTSRQRYKGLLSDRSHAVFDGRVKVRTGAQKTNSYMENRNLLLSATALANTKPSLEIDADDVKCGHGATVGQLDEKVMFYMRTRGLGPRDARAILTWAFAKQVLDPIPGEALRRRLGQEALSRIPGVSFTGELP